MILHTHFFKKTKYFLIYHLSAILVFGILYYYVQNDSEMAFASDIYKKKKYSMQDCMYFSLITQTTVGYGDIISYSENAKIVNMIQLISIFFISALSIE